MMLRRSRRAGGRTVDSVPPATRSRWTRSWCSRGPHAKVLSEAAEDIRRLRRGAALLSRTSARLRKLEVGDRLTFAGGDGVRVAGVVEDELVGFAELVLTARDSKTNG